VGKIPRPSLCKSLSNETGWINKSCEPRGPFSPLLQVRRFWMGSYWETQEVVSARSYLHKNRYELLARFRQFC
jgi:hypothetical protein